MYSEDRRELYTRMQESVDKSRRCNGRLSRNPFPSVDLMKFTVQFTCSLDFLSQDVRQNNNKVFCRSDVLQCERIIGFSKRR